MFAISCQLSQYIWRSGRLHLAILSFLVSVTLVLLDLRAQNSLLTIILAISAIVSSTVGNLTISLLSSLRMEQIIRKDGPISHYRKINTPTMGGLSAVLTSLIVGALVKNSNLNDKLFLAIVFINFTYLLIGSLDDWRSLTKNTNTGLTAKGKLVLQSLGAIIFTTIISKWVWIHREISLPFHHTLNMGVLIWPLILFILLAESNSTNLTDGLDGLLPGCSIIVITGLILQLILCGDVESTSMTPFCAATVGSWLGFLSLNRNPARIFMGDTGSLTLGATMAAIALLSKTLWPLFLMGGVFLIESISVMMQVILFKSTQRNGHQGKRLFRMTPLHHHFELAGIDESTIVALFWSISFFLMIISIFPIP
uniref:Phospho-N-acetylmuramoyl-pentapeptidetransferase n=1 Tax=Paulinella longichromatophora TaxID=1708747 RepID=A0A2H4ZPH8_9EUKA|nr:Phospho-N-acetylmuramoyl- pentapeptidetransferase [Paulinella longichromatophora]